MLHSKSVIKVCYLAYISSEVTVSFKIFQYYKRKTFIFMSYNKNKNTSFFNLKGIALSNPSLSQPLNYATIVDYSYYHGFISKQLWSYLKNQKCFDFMYYSHLYTKWEYICKSKVSFFFSLEYTALFVSKDFHCSMTA